jgi:NADH:ubiquinone oxidoreductase subunit F (NADH-binding)
VRILTDKSLPVREGEQALAPCLPEFHRILAEQGALDAHTLAPLASAFKLPLADLVSATSFYHYFQPHAADETHPVACSGPTCTLARNGAGGDLQSASLACPGLCDQAPARLESGKFQASGERAGVFEAPLAGQTAAILFPLAGPKGTEDLGAYREQGGYQTLLELAHGGSAEGFLDSIQASGLVGRGGAAFPVAAKWRAVKAAPGDDKYVICNADEGEPGTFKDRALLHLRPHLLLEGMALAGIAVGAAHGIIYLRYEYPEAFRVLTEAIEQAETAGLLGSAIDGSKFGFNLVVRRGAGSYVCGEESALLNSLEGRRPWPRERPPYPTTEGLWGKPTLINNVETFSTVPAMLRMGVEAYRSLGVNGNPGTKLYSLSGKVRRPGNYELPLGVTARELIFEHGGGMADGRQLKAFTLGGISGGLLGPDQLDLPLDYRAPVKVGANLGSGGVVVLDDTCCVVDFARSCLAFYASESCGRCFPCRIGTVRLREYLDFASGRSGSVEVQLTDLKDIGAAMGSLSACGLGQSAHLPVRALWTTFADELHEHLEGRTCRTGVCRL